MPIRKTELRQLILEAVENGERIIPFGRSGPGDRWALVVGYLMAAANMEPAERDEIIERLSKK